MIDKSNKIVQEVVIIRLLLILLIVMYHSFCMYSGAWEPISGMPEVKAYWWIAKFCISFAIEGFVFISGYLFASQQERCDINIKSLMIGKFKRLILPSILFSSLYILLFSPSISKYGVAYDILNGVGHLWFLPMLFWCFVITYFLQQIRLREDIKMLILFSFTMLPALPFPLRLGASLHNLFYFYVGTYAWKHKMSFSKINWSFVLFLTISYITIYIFAWWQANPVITRILTRVCALLGCFAVYLFALKTYSAKQLPIWCNKISTLCFGVYIFHQIILVELYKHTPFHSLVGFYALPWAGFVIAIIASLTLTYLVRKTKIGGMLI